MGARTASIRLLVTAGSIAGLLSAGVMGSEPAPVQLLTDPRFERGLEVIDPDDPQVVEDQLQRGSSAGEPAWRLAQWHSQATIAGAEPRLTPHGSWRFMNAAKEITLGPAEGPMRGVRLRMHGDYEYGGRLRQPEEPWPHLLVEQRIAEPPTIGTLAELRFHIAAQLRRSTVKSRESLQPWHCAQFQAFLTIQNTNPSSPGKGDFMWFGIPVYDSRYRQSVAHAARDTAGSNKYIYTPAGSEYSHKSAADGRWLTIDRDLLPLIHKGLNRAWTEGFLAESRDLSELRVTSINLGWELTGPLEVEMHFRDLSLTATFRE